MKAKLAVRPAPPVRVQRQPAAAAHARASPTQPPVLRIIDGGLDSRNLLRLQSVAGNQAVGELIARPRLTVQSQAIACPPPPAPAAAPAPHADPAFVAVKERVEGESVKQKEHPPAKAKVAEAQGAAQGPTNEVASKAAAAQVEDMSQKKPKGFDKAAFIAAVHVAIEKATPKNMEEVDDFQKSGKAGQMKDQVVGQVTQNKDAAARDIKAANQAPPDPSRAEAKPVTPMQAETPGAPPRDVKAGDAMPPPKPAEQVSMDNTKCETDNQLAEAHVTDEQVANSNEPQFQDAMASKKEADVHAATAPQQFREGEQQQLGAAQAGAGAATTTGLSQMHQTRASSVGHVGSHKDAAKAKNEAARAKVSAEIEGIYTATKKDVDEILTGLDGKVKDAFDSGEKAARDAFENDYKTRKDTYFNKRYSGFGGDALWVADKLTSPPAEVNGFIDIAKQLYVTKMEQVIDQVATLVETELNRSTARIQDGRTQIKEYVAKQPKDLKKVAQEAADNFSSQFDQLDQAVTDKSKSVVDDLSEKYVAASKEVDDRCNAMREENKGLLDKAKDKINAMVETIKKMKEMLAGMAARAANAVDKIIDKPIDFLGHLIDAVKAGFGQFVDNIWNHLKKGLLTWLFGEVAKAGITLPEKFDLKGILMFLAQVLGVTWSNIRSRAVKILGGKIVGMIEKGVAVVQKAIEIWNVIKTEGIAGVWHLIQDKVAEIKAQVMEAVGGMVVTEVIKAGIKWIIGLLNPASALIKACIAIYDIIMFFVNHGKDIVELVNAIIDNLEAIVGGGISTAANLVESVLGRAIPIAIGFLASLLGLGDLGSKIKAILDKIREPVNMAIDWVLSNVVKPIVSAIGSGIAWVKEKLFGKKDERSPAERQAALDSAMGEAQGVLSDPATDITAVQKKLPEIRAKHDVEKLELVVEKPGEQEEVVHIEGANSPAVQGAPVTKKLGQLSLWRYLPSSYLAHGAIRKRLYEAGSGWEALRKDIDDTCTQNIIHLIDMGTLEGGRSQRQTIEQLVREETLPAEALTAFDGGKKKIDARWFEASTAKRPSKKDAKELKEEFDEFDSLSPPEQHERMEAWIAEGILPASGTAVTHIDTDWFDEWMDSHLDWHVDHIKPLAQHWIEKGQNGEELGPDGRFTICTSKDNLRWITQKANLKKGSKTDTDEDAAHFLDMPWVGPGFTSKRAEGGNKGASTIDGEPFLDPPPGKHK